VLTLNDFFIRGFIREALESGVGRGGLLLDVGCGMRPYESLFRQYHVRTVGLDVTKDGSVADVVADAKRLPFDQDAFELVLCSEVIEHLDDYDGVIEEIARVLQPGGILIITWPFIYSLHDIPADYNRFTEFGMERNLKRHGLEIVKLRRRGDSLGVLHTIVGQYGCGLMEALVRIPLVGVLVRPLQRLFEWLVIATYWIHYAVIRRFKRLNPGAVGEGLRGIPGALTLWTLGYCGLARKVGVACRS
jgi:SAM-dependent methyltransferase